MMIDDLHAQKATLRDAARRRINNGYHLPELPTGEQKWNVRYREYLGHLTAVMKARSDDYNASSFSLELKSQASNALMAISLLRSSRDVDMIKCHHKLILEVSNAHDIRYASLNLKKLYPDVPPSEIITASHVDACYRIRQAVRAWDSRRSRPERLVERLTDEMTMFTLERVEHADKIIDLIDRDVIQLSRIAYVLEDVDTDVFAVVGGAL